MRNSRVIAVAMAALLAAGCAATGVAGEGARGGSGSRDVLMREELREVEASLANAYDAVERLRPQWLRGRGGAQAIVVYIDDVRQGQVGVLRSLAIRNIGQMRWVSPQDAQFRFGMDHTGGVIMVTTTRAY